MIPYLIDLIGSYFSSGMAAYWFFPFIALAFVSFVPVLIRSLFSWG